MQYKIALLGGGTWGFALANLLAKNGHKVTLWTRSPQFAQELSQKATHPKLPGSLALPTVAFTSDIAVAVKEADFIVESVTSSGIRPVFTTLLPQLPKKIPIIITSKGIEQHTSLLLPELLFALLQEKNSPFVGCLSGPSHAEEVIKDLPTSVVASSFNPELTDRIVQLFTRENFRVYPSQDLYGICFGGAMKNIIAIACGISDGLGFGDNSKAALMTRGLHEIRKLAEVKGCDPSTLNGLSGLGDLTVSCLSTFSRNYRFGALLGRGYTAAEAKQTIGMVVEGEYSCVSAWELARQHQIATPITDATYRIIYEDTDPHQEVRQLLNRKIKKEHL